jgi:radical SAM superfamily enzyme with C-terminal helix-hairpin-helix motif
VTTIPSTVTLNANNPSAIVNFLLENGRIITGIKENTSSNISSISDIFPNPAVDKANIIVVSALEMSVTLTIFNSTGQTVKEMPFSLQKGSNTITFTTSGFYEGMYYIRIQCTEGDAVMKKFVIGK